jgi:CHASE2 domain-containing sensor protein
VVIGDARGTREPLRAHPDGRLLPSVVAHAVALDWLIDGRAIRRPHALEVWNFYVGPRFAAELFTAGLACALALALARRPRALIAAILALCGVVAGASVAAFAGAGILLAPHGAVLVLVLVACCVWSVHRWGRGVELG